MATITQKCNKCGNDFLIIEREQQFLQEKKFPLPTMCPSCRQTRRLMLRGERTLYKTKCQKCQKDIVVSYDPQKTNQTILCKNDYEQYFADNDPIINEPLPEL